MLHKQDKNITNLEIIGKRYKRHAQYEYLPNYRNQGSKFPRNILLKKIITGTNSVEEIRQNLIGQLHLEHLKYEEKQKEIKHLKIIILYMNSYTHTHIYTSYS